MVKEDLSENTTDQSAEQEAGGSMGLLGAEWCKNPVAAVSLACSRNKEEGCERRVRRNGA